MSFPQRLRAARELRQWTQAELASRAVFPSSSIAHFETGSRKPSFDNLKRLAEALEVNADYLLGRVGHSGMMGGTDPILSKVWRLSGDDRALAMDFLQMLVDRETVRRQRNDVTKRERTASDVSQVVDIVQEIRQ